MTATTGGGTTARQHAITTALYRALLWEAHECYVLLPRDLWRSRHWPGWGALGRLMTLGAKTAFGAFVAVTAVLTVAVVLVVSNTTAADLAFWSVVGYPVIAGATGVPRARHHIRRDLRYAAVAVTRGNLDDPPDARRRHYRQPRPRQVRWVRFTRQLKSASLPVASTWQQGSDEAADKLRREVRKRLEPRGSYALDWQHGRPSPHVREVTPLPRLIEARSSWTPPVGRVLIGATEGQHPSAVEVDGQPFAAWDRADDPHILLAGPSGRGKTSALRWITWSLIASARADGQQVRLAALDGKGAGNLSFLNNRRNVIEVANYEAGWVKTTERIDAEMSARYDELLAWSDDPEHVDDPTPRWDRIILIADELVDMKELAGDAFLDPFGRIVRLGREANIVVVASVLRPDATESIPGIIKDSLSARVLLGPVRDQTSARMMYGDDWREAKAASDNMADGWIAGRGTAGLGGVIYPVQIPWVPDPRRHPAGATWLPPRLEPKAADVHDLDDARQRTTTRRQRRGAATGTDDE